MRGVWFAVRTGGGAEQGGGHRAGWGARLSLLSPGCGAGERPQVWGGRGTSRAVPSAPSGVPHLPVRAPGRPPGPWEQNHAGPDPVRGELCPQPFPRGSPLCLGGDRGQETPSGTPPQCCGVSRLSSAPSSATGCRSSSRRLTSPCGGVGRNPERCPTPQPPSRPWHRGRRGRSPCSPLSAPVYSEISRFQDLAGCGGTAGGSHVTALLPPRLRAPGGCGNPVG